MVYEHWFLPWVFAKKQVRVIKIILFIFLLEMLMDHGQECTNFAKGRRNFFYTHLGKGVKGRWNRGGMGVIPPPLPKLIISTRGDRLCPSQFAPPPTFSDLPPAVCYVMGIDTNFVLQKIWSWRLKFATHKSKIR